MSDLLNTGQFWNLEKDFFDESVNSNPLNYNTYEEFITGSKSNLNLKKFQYEDPFKFTPSYGSSVSIIFYQDTPSMGDSYVSVNQALMNRVEISFDLQFNDRGNEETDRLNSYIDSKEGHKVFPFQMFNQNDLTSQELYKSLYSLPPYFVQEFKCVEKQMENIYTDHNSMKLTLLNQDYSQFSVRNILRVNSMPQEKKDIIDEYSSKYHLDIKPSYSITRDEEYNLDRFQMGNRTRPFEKSKGINKTITDIRLELANGNNFAGATFSDGVADRMAVAGGGGGCYIEGTSGTSHDTFNGGDGGGTVGTGSQGQAGTSRGGTQSGGGTSDHGSTGTQAQGGNAYTSNDAGGGGGGYWGGGGGADNGGGGGGSGYLGGFNTNTGGYQVGGHSGMGYVKIRKL